MFSTKLLITAFPKSGKSVLVEGNFTVACALCIATGDTVIASPVVTRPGVVTRLPVERVTRGEKPVRLWMVRAANGCDIAICPTPFRAVARVSVLRDLLPTGTKIFVRSIQV